ncbi:protein FANTASTIC FOUR 1-like [Phoenix dactylifera]|uniref:Protein FANTASTIC FOUR 1-like n=1 Tax=Phoenix dactylifera TaxID=42345 RepID=A0A8B7MU07_PHODC|nr:protein FANTASTIC FOUR 1-like [Phoenix dactylifera]
MATLGSLSSLFENPMPENPTLFDPLSSWNQTKPKKPGENSSFTEIFGELHFQEKPAPTSEEKNGRNGSTCDPKSNGGFLVKNTESLQLCTEGLGSESSGDVDDLMKEGGDDWSDLGKEKDTERQSPHDGVDGGYSRSLSQVRSRGGGGFPPPISSIGKSGKPWISFKSYREDGRFVLREIRTPTHDFLQASREDGRLKLHIVHPEEAISEGEEGEREEEAEEVEEEEEEEEKKIADEGHGD